MFVDSRPAETEERQKSADFDFGLPWSECSGGPALGVCNGVCVFRPPCAH